MYRTYELTGNEKYVLTNFDSDCVSYTVCDSLEEMEQEKQRWKKIDEEYQEAMRRYLNS